MSAQEQKAKSLTAEELAELQYPEDNSNRKLGLVYNVNDMALSNQSAFTVGYNKALEDKWVSVESGLPKVGLTLAYQNYEIYVSFYDGITTPFFTHWCLIPSPPKP